MSGSTGGDAPGGPPEPISRTTGTYPVLPAGADPRRLPPELLAFCGLPEAPDGTKLPRYRAFWDALMSPPQTGGTLTCIQPVYDSVDMDFVPSRLEGSPNWSGLYVKPHHGRRFTKVMAAWTVPEVAAPTGAPAADEYRSSTWIGLDGQRRYHDSTLPQIGTGQVVNPTAPKPAYGTWYQWWVRGDPHNKEILLNLPVGKGDVVMAMLTVLGDGKTVRFTLKNHTTGQMLGAFTDTRTGYAVSGATAEWIMERPGDPKTDRTYDLPRFGSTVGGAFMPSFAFTRCLAVSEDADGTQHEHTLVGGRAIRMRDTPSAPHRARVIARGRRVPGDDQTVKVECLLP